MFSTGEVGAATCVMGGTQAGVVANAVNTGGAIVTSVVLAVVYVHLAEGPVKTKSTHTTAGKRTDTTRKFLFFQKKTLLNGNVS